MNRAIHAAKGKKTYTGIAVVVAGAILQQVAPHLDAGTTAILTPELAEWIARGLMGAGAALATFGRWAASQYDKPVDQQSVVTPRSR